MGLEVACTVSENALGLEWYQARPFQDSAYLENMANDTCLALLFFKLALICMYKMPSMVASIQ